MKDEPALFQYATQNNNSEKTLFLFHGTGGSEQDFFFLDTALHGNYNLVGLRGNVVESGMRRFFQRDSRGNFDKESIKQEAAKVHKFIVGWQQKYGLSSDNTYCLGYSNGANMIIATIFLYPDTFKTGVVLHPMLPFRVSAETKFLSDYNFFMSCGTHDPLVANVESDAVWHALTACGARLVVRSYASGHAVSDEEMFDVVTYLMKPH